MRILLELALLTRKSFWLCKRPCCFPMNINSMAKLQMLGFLTRSELMRNSWYSLWSPVNAGDLSVLSTFIYWNHLHLVCTHIIRFQRCIVYSFEHKKNRFIYRVKIERSHIIRQYLSDLPSSFSILEHKNWGSWYLSYFLRENNFWLFTTATASATVFIHATYQSLLLCL